ncbi:MAG: hypothetical protein MZW92_71235 [Comamonadaceae bacterium]|nr:hypothetical protein [Comamonadaceae bacterium]
MSDDPRAPVPDSATLHGSRAPSQPGPLPLLDRERSILQFNRRVLAQARRDDVPLLERLRYITIVSSQPRRILRGARGRHHRGHAPARLGRRRGTTWLRWPAPRTN